jgi:hypothetical protein
LWDLDVGGAPTVDSCGILYLTTGNGVFDDTTSTLPPVVPDNDFSKSFLKIDSSNLTVEGVYAPPNEAAWSDGGFSSSGVTAVRWALDRGAGDIMLLCLRQVS